MIANAITKDHAEPVDLLRAILHSANYQLAASGRASDARLDRGRKDMQELARCPFDRGVILRVVTAGEGTMASLKMSVTPELAGA